MMKEHNASQQPSSDEHDIYFIASEWDADEQEYDTTYFHTPGCRPCLEDPLYRRAEKAWARQSDTG